MTQLSKWAPNKARKEKPRLHILKLSLVPVDAAGRLQLALTRLTLYSDPRDLFFDLKTLSSEPAAAQETNEVQGLSSHSG